MNDSGEPLSYSTVPEAKVSGRARFFWRGFLAFGALLLLASIQSFGRLTPNAILLQSACIVWIVACVLHAIKHRAQLTVASVGVMILWLPVCGLVIQRVYYWRMVGMESRNGMGSPLAFLIGFMFEQVLFWPLTLLLYLSLKERLWRGGTVV